MSKIEKDCWIYVLIINLIRIQTIIIKDFKKENDNNHSLFLVSVEAIW